MKNIMWIILVILFIPTMALANPSNDNVFTVVKEHISTSLDKGEEDESKREEIIDSIIEIEDRESRKELMELMKELKNTLSQDDKDQIENSQKILDEYNQSKIISSKQKGQNNGTGSVGKKFLVFVCCSMLVLLILYVTGITTIYVYDKIVK